MHSAQLKSLKLWLFRATQVRQLLGGKRPVTDAAPFADKADGGDVLLPTAQETGNAISLAASKIYSRKELAQMTEQSGLSFRSLLGRRLGKSGPAPSLAELKGIRQHAEEHLWRPTQEAERARAGRNNSREAPAIRSTRLDL